MSATARYRADDLRRLAAELLAGAGVDHARASAMARQLLWYDGAGAHRLGIAGLEGWLSRIEGGDFAPSEIGRVGPEHASTAVVEADRGLPPLVLAHAAEIAGQKARDTGAGIVRVVGLPRDPGPSAAVAADLAIGPYIGAVLGPGSVQAAALPSADGVPLVFDSAFAASTPARDDPIGPMLDRLAPWTLMATEGVAVVAALAVSAFEPLTTFHQQIDAALQGREAPIGWIFPASWDRSLRASLATGVPLVAEVADALRRRSETAGLPFPEALAEENGDIAHP